MTKDEFAAEVYRLQGLAVDRTVDDGTMDVALAAFLRLDYDRRELALAEHSIRRSMEWRALEHHV